MKIIYSFLLVLITSSSASAQQSVPDWAIGAVWYQIVPERFRNGVPRNDPTKARVIGKRELDWQVHPWASDWYKSQVWEQDSQLEFAALTSLRRYGGDLHGIGEKLEYLKSLGVDVIYLGPVFESPSVLKYDASTLHHVDNNFGMDRERDWKAIVSEKEDPAEWSMTTSDEIFYRLIGAAHELDIKVVMDVVFNYCGREFWAFTDVQDKQEKSKFKEWFDVVSWDDPATPDTVEFAYKCWQGDKNLPVFRQDEEGLVEPVKKYIFDITRRWMQPEPVLEKAKLAAQIREAEKSNEQKKQEKSERRGRRRRATRGSKAGLDGWFVHHPESLPKAFWTEWVDSVKAINPNAVTAAKFNEQLEADSPFDIATNPALGALILDFFITGDVASVSEFKDKLLSLQKASWQTRMASLNFLDSHETDRLATMITNPHRAHLTSSGENNNHGFDPRKPTQDDADLHRLISLFQLTYLGAPVIFYGDESGMWGVRDYDNKPMLWGDLFYEKEQVQQVYPDITEITETKVNEKILSAYRGLNQLRQKNPAFREGEIEFRIVDDEKHILAYSRKHGRNEVYVFLNVGDEDQTIDFELPWEKGVKILDAFKGKKFKIKEQSLKLTLEKKWGVILVKEK